MPTERSRNALAQLAEQARSQQGAMRRLAEAAETAGAFPEVRDGLREIAEAYDRLSVGVAPPQREETP